MISLNKNRHTTTPLPKATLALTLPIRSLDDCETFYAEYLGFEVEQKDDTAITFKNLALSNCLHVKFLLCHGTEETIVTPSEDHLIIFYLENTIHQENVCKQLINEGIYPVKSLNPYWDRNGMTFEGPGGYRIVFCSSRYQNIYRARIAWPTDHFLEEAILMEKNFGLKQIGGFDNHDGFDGRIFTCGHSLDCHIEITHHKGHPAPRHPKQYRLELVTMDTNHAADIHFSMPCAVSKIKSNESQ